MIDADWIRERLSGAHGEKTRLADAMGIDIDKLSKVLQGKRRIQPAEIAGAMRFFGASLGPDPSAKPAGLSEGAGVPTASGAATDPRAGLAMPSGTNDMRVNIQGGQLIVNAAVDKKGVEALKKMIEAYEAMLE